MEIIFLTKLNSSLNVLYIILRTLILQVLVECDPVMKQFLLHLDDKLLLGSHFVIQDLDERRLFISADVLELLQERIDDLMDKISVPVIANE